MIRSMWSGVQGLYVHQQEMDVIGNNIANVNSTSYKAQTTFSDLLYQNTQRAYGATAGHSGTNAKQVGLGTVTSSIMTAITKQGSIQTTDAPFDMAISGDSFFQVATTTQDITQNANAPLDVINYTRDGSFTLDENGYLVTRAEGMYVLGTMTMEGDDVNRQIGQGELRPIQVMDVDVNDPERKTFTMPGESTSLATFTGNISRVDENLSRKGTNVYLEVYGGDGNLYSLKFNVTDSGDEDPSTYKATVQGIYDEEGKALTREVTDEDGVVHTENVLPNVKEIDLVFDLKDGKFVSANGETSGEINFSGGAGATGLGSFTVDFSTLTNYAPTNAGISTASELEAYKGQYNELGEAVGAGYPSGEMNGVSVGKDGKIFRLYSNGQTRFAGQIVVAEFANASGLEKTGTNRYQQTQNSGGARNMYVDADGGQIANGTLEMSNVDLANEFTNMITAQRGFQANSKVITTSDELLQELRNLKR